MNAKSIKKADWETVKKSNGIFRRPGNRYLPLFHEYKRQSIEDSSRAGFPGLTG